MLLLVFPVEPLAGAASVSLDKAVVMVAKAMRSCAVSVGGVLLIGVVALLAAPEYVPGLVCRLRSNNDWLLMAA